jgi:hypothetical protein
VVSCCDSNTVKYILSDGISRTADTVADLHDSLHIVDSSHDAGSSSDADACGDPTSCDDATCAANDDADHIATADHDTYDLTDYRHHRPEFGWCLLLTTVGWPLGRTTSRPHT